MNFFRFSLRVQNWRKALGKNCNLIDFSRARVKSYKFLKTFLETWIRIPNFILIKRLLSPTSLSYICIQIISPSHELIWERSQKSFRDLCRLKPFKLFLCSKKSTRALKLHSRMKFRLDENCHDGNVKPKTKPVKWFHRSNFKILSSSLFSCRSAWMWFPLSKVQSKNAGFAVHHELENIFSVVFFMFEVFYELCGFLSEWNHKERISEFNNYGRRQFSLDDDDKHSWKSRSEGIQWVIFSLYRVEKYCFICRDAEQLYYRQIGGRL